MSEKKICNRCGKELDFFDLQEDFSIHKRIGYGSVYDGYTVDYHLCCECFDNEVERCMVSPIQEKWEQCEDESLHSPMQPGA